MKILRFILALSLLSSLCNLSAQSTTEQNDSISTPDSLNCEKELMEVVVTAHRKYVMPTGRGLKVSMIGNPVAQLGSASAALRQLPMIDSSNGALEVLGHGTPQIYINNKLVRNSTELELLSAENIKDVEIITNPSSKYGTDVSSVILIRTRRLNEGFHAVAGATAGMAEVFSSSGDLNLNYHSENGLTFFSDFSCGTSAFRQKRFYGESFYRPDSPDEIFRTITNSTSDSRTLSLSVDGGFNYDFSNHSAGVKYAFYRTPRSHYADEAITELHAHEEASQLSSNTDLTSQRSMHLINMFADISLPFSLNLRIDADYMNASKKSVSSVVENESTGWVSNANHTLSRLCAARIVLSRKLRSTELEIGTDLSLTSNNQDFTSEASDDLSFLHPGEDDVKQNLRAVFGSFDWSPNQRWNIYGGVRCESTDCKYRHDNILNPELSRSYDNFLPNIGVSFNSWISASLFYRASVFRPSYQSLDNNFIYVTPTLWETGNPELKSSMIHRFGLNLSYKKFILQSSFRINEGSTCAVYYFDKDKDVSVTKPVNLPQFNSFQVVAVQQLDFGFWHPTLQGVVCFQNLHYGMPRRSYDRPIWTLSLNNRIDIPGGIYAYLNVFCLGSGNQEVVYSNATWQASLTLNKSWRNWTCTISANDMLGTWRQPFDTRTNAIEYSSDRKGASRFLSLSLRYTLNSAKGRYKGKTARQDEIDRL